MITANYNQIIMLSFKIRIIWKIKTRSYFYKTKLTLKYNSLTELFKFKIINKKINIKSCKNKKKMNYNYN